MVMPWEGPDLRARGLDYQLWIAAIASGKVLINKPLSEVDKGTISELVARLRNFLSADLATDGQEWAPLPALRKLNPDLFGDENLKDVTEQLEMLSQRSNCGRVAQQCWMSLSSYLTTTQIQAFTMPLPHLRRSVDSGDQSPKLQV